MGRPKHVTTPRKTGLRRSHLVLELARRVNSRLSKAGAAVKVKTTKREGAGKIKAKKAA